MMTKYKINSKSEEIIQFDRECTNGNIYIVMRLSKHQPMGLRGHLGVMRENDAQWLNKMAAPMKREKSGVFCGNLL